jgi:hypothetical protein
VQTDRRSFPCKSARFILPSEANNPDSLNCKTLLDPPGGEKEKEVI